ncbi:unnamed protein product [Peronospora belbahrii]|uniref:Uncharacterized protein n=1 Tax=Peronospora belbahrii TaxID=622444 RepID=A0ABN8D1T6_9STRA|nr:unnamed protein product [Peronospora belbahrii]
MAMSNGLNGKVLLRLMNARAAKADQCSRHDLVYSTSLRAAGTIATFSGETFAHVSLAFIGLADTENNVPSLLPSASPEIVEEKQALTSKAN